MGKQVEVLEHHAHFLPHGVKLTVRHMCQVSPSNRICPPLGCSRRFRHRRKVLLPEPDGPIMTTFSPFFNVGGNVFQNVEIAERLVQMFNLDHCVPASFPDVLPENSES